MRELSEKEINEVNGGWVAIAAFGAAMAGRYVTNALVRHYIGSFGLAAGAYGLGVEYGGK